MADLESQIRELWDRKDELGPADADAAAVVHAAIDLLDRGDARVAELGSDGEPVVHEWSKQAVLLLFRVSELSVTEAGPFEYVDRLPLKRNFAAAGVRGVRPLGELP
jgi:2,3,4,5-tetrahydropyridine-2-carboxylate N-succinyltransferase